jgi:hypothetical protein
MNWEALSVIGLFALALGALLYLPAIIWARLNMRSEPNKHPRVRLTRVGWALVFAAVLVLFGGFGLQYVAPQSAIGALVKSPSGRLVLLGSVLLVFWLLESALAARGIRLTRQDHHE